MNVFRSSLVVLFVMPAFCREGVNAEQATLGFPETVPWADRFKPLRFEVAIPESAAGSLADAVTLSLDDGSGERFARAERTATGYAFESPLLDELTWTHVPIRLTLSDAELTCVAEDRALDGADGPYLLSELNGYERGKGLLTKDGKIVRLGSEHTMLTLYVTDEPFEISLQEIATFRIDPREEPTIVRYRLSTQAHGVVAKGEIRITGRPDRGAAASEKNKEPDTVPPTIPAHKAFVGTMECAVPAQIGRVTLAGSGRFMLLRMDKISRLAVFDTAQLKIVKLIPLPEASTLIAGGASTFVMVHPNQKVIERWRLETLEREVTETLGLPGFATNVGMGCGSEGPLMIRTTNKEWAPRFIDLQTFEPIPHLSNFRLGFDINRIFRFSQDGQTVCVADMMFRLSEGMDLKGRVLRMNPLPGPNGDYFYTRKGIFAPNGVNIAEPPPGIRPIPSALPAYYLGLGSPSPGSAQGSILLRLFAKDAPRPVITFQTPEVQLPNTNDFDPPASLGQWVHYVPQAAVLITIPPERNRLVARYVDLETHLKKADMDYFFVDSIPVTRVAQGAHYQYPIRVKAKGANVRYTLTVGPEGMGIDENGLLSWHVPEADLGKTNVVVGLQRGDGKELYHAFAIVVVP